MNIITIARIAFETLKNTSKDLAEIIKILSIVINALNQQGYIETSRGIEAETLDDDSLKLVNSIIEQVRAESP